MEVLIESKSNAFFPPPPALEKGKEWHFFISYRSADRQWVIKLYDALQQFGYKVFVDQFVLTAGRLLASSLADGLDSSMGAVVVWSKNYQNSTTEAEEFFAIANRAAQDRSFRFVVATLDR